MVKLRIAVIGLSVITVALGIGWALRFSRAHDIRMPLYNPFFLFLLPAIGLIALAVLSFVLDRERFRIISIILVFAMAIGALAAPVTAFPALISLIGIVALNVGRQRADKEHG